MIDDDEGNRLDYQRRNIMADLHYKKIGEITVDSGRVWIGDPCYVIHEEEGLPPTLGNDWLEFCKMMDGKEFNQFDHDGEIPGLGICASTSEGDGIYPVFAITNSQGRYLGIFVDFSGTIENG